MIIAIAVGYVDQHEYSLMKEEFYLERKLKKYTKLLDALVSPYPFR